MTKEQILEALKSGKQITVASTWYYLYTYMTCSGADEEYSCCSDSYTSYEEALGSILCMAREDLSDVEIN